MPEEKKSRKSTVEEIRSRFDNDVKRISKEHTGQTSTVDSQYVLDLVMDTISLAGFGKCRLQESGHFTHEQSFCCHNGSKVGFSPGMNCFVSTYQ